MNFEDRSVIFISAYSQENFELAKRFCKKYNSYAVFWNNKELNYSRDDFMSIFMNNTDGFFEKCFVIPVGPGHEDFACGLSNVVLPIYSEDIIFKGTLSQVWQYSLIKKDYEIQSNSFLILDYFEKPLGEVEKNTLDCFDKIVSMGKSGDIDYIKSKNSILFDHIEPFFYGDISRIKSDVDIDTDPLVLISSKSDEKIVKYIYENKICSILDVESIADKDLCIFMNLSNPILDITRIKDIELILQKIGKKSINKEEFLESLSDLNKMKDICSKSIFERDKNIAKYTETLYKKIEKDFLCYSKNKLEGKTIVVF